MSRWLLVATLPVLLALGCAKPVTPAFDYTRFRAEHPTSILVVPVVNKSVDVTAPDYFLSTLTYPIAERGYYVFPTYLVKRVMEDDGLADADMVHRADPRKLGELFGADAILYITIDKWAAKYAVVSTTVEVEFDYVMKSAKSGEVIWKNHQAWVYTPQNQDSGLGFGSLISAAIHAAITKAAPDYLPLARQANGNAFYPKHTGLPAGPYRENHEKDHADF